MPESSSLTRSKALIGGAIVAVVAAAVVVGVLAWHASSLEVRDGVRGEADVVAVDGWATPSGYVVVSGDERTQTRELVALDEDGVALARADLASDRVAQVSMAGDVVFLDDGHERDVLVGAAEISALRWQDGRFEPAWSQGFTLDGSDEQLVELMVAAHSAADETAVFGCARAAGSCWLIGVDGDGEELWRVVADGLHPALGADRSGDERPWLAPEELLVMAGPGSVVDRDENGPVLLVDLSTGDMDQVAVGARVVTGHGFAAISTVDDGGCGLAVLRDAAVRWETDVSCDDDGRPPLHSVAGRTVTFRSGEEVVAIDVDQERTGTVPQDTWTSWTGVGTALLQAPNPQLRSMGDELITDLGRGWGTGAVGADTVVVHRAHRSSNPLAASTATEVKVIDAEDGSVCARARFDGQPARIDRGRAYVALPGCAALIEVDGTTHLLGR